MTEPYDPDVDELHQETPYPLGGGVYVDMVEADPVPLDMLPLRIGATMTFNLVQRVPVKLLNADPRRAYVYMVTPNTPGIDVCVAGSRNEIEEHTTCWNHTFTQGMQRVNVTGELWAMQHAAADTTIAVLTENWSL